MGKQNTHDYLPALIFASFLENRPTISADLNKNIVLRKLLPDFVFGISPVRFRA